jgi:hypothetical protein
VIEAGASAAEKAPSVDVPMLEARPPDHVRREGPKLGKRCKMGCYVCGIKCSSRFHRWRDSKVALLIKKIEAKRPESEEICARCLMYCHRQSSSTEYHEVCSQYYHYLSWLPLFVCTYYVDNRRRHSLLTYILDECS